MNIAFLGLGKMGSAIVKHLLKQHNVTVWNRSPRAAEEMAAQGAAVAASPAQAARGAELMITMLMDDAAHEDVLFSQGALAALSNDAVLVTLSTISVGLAEKVALAASAARVGYVGCPVFGRPNVAEAGSLYLIAAGKREAVERARPALTTFSREVKVVGEHAPAAHAFKLCGNFLIAAVIASLSEAAHAAERHQIEASLFLATINEALFRSPFYETYSKLLLHVPQQAGATIALGEKDIRLFLEATVAAGGNAPLAALLEEQFQRGLAQGRGEQDWASGWYAMSDGS